MKKLSRGLIRVIVIAVIMVVSTGCWRQDYMILSRTLNLTWMTPTAIETASLFFTDFKNY